MGNCFGVSINTHICCTTARRPVSPVNYAVPSREYSYDNRLSSTSSGNNSSSVGCGTVSSSSTGTSSGGGGGRDEENFPDGRILSSPNLRIFSLAELKIATKNFKNDNILGEGGFGRVFKGYIDDKTSKSGNSLAVAIKKLNQESLQGVEEWEAEVKFLGRLSHPNLVRLVGYCWEDSDLLLIYEFMPRGSLDNHLFRNNSQPLSWELRMNILIGVAKGLAFLHTSERQIIYRDFKASNILLDMHYNAKLSDFGLAKYGPLGGDTHVTTRIMGTNGYAAPEYVATGHLYVKSDVYGFGVVLLEMLTGLRALDTNRPTAQHKLVEWVKPFLTHRKKLLEIMDPRFGNQYPQKAARQAAALANKCLEPEQKCRPSMKDVLQTLQQIEAIKDRTHNPRSSPIQSMRTQKTPVHPRPDGGTLSHST